MTIRNNMMGGMMDMMNNMMSGNKNANGNNESFWEMCMNMMSNMTNSSNFSNSTSPEIRQLFEEWAVQIENEILTFINQAGTIDVDKLQDHFKLKRENIVFFLNRLAQKGKINYNAN